MAMITIPTPPTSALPTSSWLRPRTTAWPKPPAPTKAAMTTIESLGRLDGILGHLLDAEQRQPHCRGRRKDDRRDERRRAPEAQEHDHRDQVYERGHRLHDVERGTRHHLGYPRLGRQY